MSTRRLRTSLGSIAQTPSMSWTVSRKPNPSRWSPVYTREHERDHSKATRALYPPQTLAMWSNSGSGVFTWSTSTSPCQWRLSLSSSRSQAPAEANRARTRLARAWSPFPRRTKTSAKALGGGPRSKPQVALDCAAPVVGELLMVAAGASLHRLGPVEAAIDAEELLPLAVKAGDFAADLGHPPPARLVLVRKIGGIVGQAPAGGGKDESVAPDGVGNVLGVLDVERVLDDVPLGRELAEREHAQAPRPPARVGDPEAPVLELLAQRHEVRGLAADAPPFALDDRVAQAESGGRLVLVQGLADRLPGR